MDNFKKEIQALIEEYNEVGDIDLFISEIIKCYQLLKNKGI